MTTIDVEFHSSTDASKTRKTLGSVEEVRALAKKIRSTHRTEGSWLVVGQRANLAALGVSCALDSYGDVASYTLAGEQFFMGQGYHSPDLLVDFLP